MPILKLKDFEQIQLNRLFCRMYGLAVIEVISLSGHLSNIDEMTKPSWNRVKAAGSLFSQATRTHAALNFG